MLVLQEFMPQQDSCCSCECSASPADTPTAVTQLEQHVFFKGIKSFEQGKSLLSNTRY